jgi:hypothetical protein
MGSGVMKNFTPVALVLVLTSAACSSGATTSPVTTAPSLNTITITGTVPAAVNSVGQSDPVLHLFTVGQSGGTPGSVSFTLTSAIETLPGGTVIPGVVMGIAIGAPAGSTCTLSAGVSPQPIQVSATGLNASLNPGSYCVQISDETIQQGPTNYTLVIVTPQ